MLIFRYSVVLCHQRIACLKEENFNSAHKFLPERWLPNSELKPHRKTLVFPFGAGRRICPGRKLAEQQLVIFLASLFSQFHWTLEEELKAEFNFLLAPKDFVYKIVHR